ncbi:MAG: 5'-3' exonuclease [Granulosicoccaceae bacterium]
MSDLSPARNGRVYLVDASIYVYQGFKSVPSSTLDSEGVQSNAVHGFINSLLQLFESEGPHYIACAFDPTNNARARQAIDARYKQHRKPRPPELISQFAVCRRWCDAIGVAQFEPSGHEADDVIAALADTARAQQLPVTVVSADKDLAQVIRPGDEVWELQKNRRLQYGRLRKRLGVAPEQVPDLLALCGDKVDNIAGVPGVGPRMAARLLARWGDLKTLSENLDAVAAMKFRGAAAIAPVLQEYWPVVVASRRLTGVLAVGGLPTDVNALARCRAGNWRDMARHLALPERVIERWRMVLA